MKKKLSLVVVLLFTLCLSMQVYAKESSTYSVGSLYNCSIAVSVSSDGIGITYLTCATERATEIGCKDIVLQEKVDGKWKNITIPNGKTTNSYSYGGSSLYTKAVKGRSYRAYCTHYANFNGTSKSLNNESDTVVFN